MLFNSFDFVFFFLPITWALYQLVRLTWLRPVLLTISGYVFYAWGRPWIALLLFASSTTDFLLGLWMDGTENRRARQGFLLGSLVFNLGLLGTFKYSGWLFANLNGAMTAAGLTWKLPVLTVPLPPGISFYTFQSLAYIIDIYRRKLRAHRHIWDYWSFVAFFPQLFAGPIERAGHLLPQLTHPRKRVNFRAMEWGLFMVLWGLLKKVVVADNMGNLVELCRGNMAVHGAGMVLALAFTVQIYADFSGYTDIARGCARLFGVRLRRNFLTPYFSCSPSEFWQRWHISLSSWIRDYLYIPLGGNRYGALRTVRNVLVTMLLAGLWHGAGWFFIAWGLYHGLLLVLYRLWPLDAWLKSALGDIGKVMAAICFFGLTVAGWVLFYLGSNGTFAEVFFPAYAAAPAVGLGALAYGLCLFALPLVLTDWLGYRKNREFIDLWPHLPPAGKTLLYVLVFYLIVMFGARENHEFIYFRF